MIEPGKPVTLVVGERVLRLRYPLRILKRMDEETGISVFRGLGDSFQDPGKLAVLLHYGLVTDQPDASVDWVEENIDASMLLEMAPKLAYAISGKLPEEAVPNGAAPGPTGSSSGPSGAMISDSLNPTSGQ